MTTYTSQLVEFLGSELQSSGPCHIVFLIKLGPNNYLKVSNVDRNEPPHYQTEFDGESEKK